MAGECFQKMGDVYVEYQHGQQSDPNRIGR